MIIITPKNRFHFSPLQQPMLEPLSSCILPPHTYLSFQFNPKYHTRFTPTIGSTQFHSAPVVYNRRMTYLNHTIVKQLQSSRLDISVYYIYWRWEFIFKSIRKMGHTSVHIDEKEYRNVLTDIVGVSWQGLRVLKLHIPNTYSVQAISWLDSPYLEVLDITVTVSAIKKPFTKALFPNLKTLKIQSDQKGQLDLTRAQFTDNQPLTIQLHWSFVKQHKNKPKTPMEDYSFLSKLGSHNCRDESYEQQNKKVKIMSSMKKRLMARYNAMSGTGQSKVSSNQSQKIIDCLLQRKFEVIVDQEQQRRQQLLGGIVLHAVQEGIALQAVQGHEANQ